MSKRFFINGITLSRLLLLPFLLVTHQPFLPLLILCWIGFSDFLDGFLARFWNSSSIYGATLDQWVDKVVSITLLVFYLYHHQIDLWFVLLYSIREFIVLLARRHNWCAGNSSFISKAKTLVTYLLFILIALNNQYPIFLNLYYNQTILIAEVLISFLSVIGLIMGMQPHIQQNYIRCISTGFYSAHIFKKAPGTITTFVFFFLGWWCKDVIIQYKIVATILLIVLHYIVYPIYIQSQSQEDPGEYTLDEIVAVAILFCFVPMRWWTWSITFLLFRFFDIKKPLGIRKLEEAKRFSASTRVLGDDVIAAVYTLLLIELILYVFR